MPHVITLEYETDGMDTVSDHNAIRLKMSKAFRETVRPYVNLKRYRISWKYVRKKK